MLFNQGWVSALIGIITFIIGCLLYRASRIGPRPVYQFGALRLIGKEEQELPGEVKVLFSNRAVPRLTKTHLILWNSGKATLEGENIVVDDPLRLEFSKGAQVVKVHFPKITRKANNFTARINPDSPNQVICNFDYLDVRDGVVIELLHTDKERYPKVQGSIRGIPKGILNWGRISPPLRISKEIPEIIMIILGFLFILILVSDSKRRISSDNFLDFLAVIGFAGLFSFILRNWLRGITRRFPKCLIMEDFEKF